MCRLCRHYLYRAEGTPKLFIIHYSLLIRKSPPCAPVAFIYKSPLITFCREGIYAFRNNGTDKSVPYIFKS